jgi:hypothetical protein
MHPDQRERAMDAGLGLWRGVGMKTGRLIGAACRDLFMEGIPRKRGCIQRRSSPNPVPGQVTKPAPPRIGKTQAHKPHLRESSLQ